MPKWLKICHLFLFTGWIVPVAAGAQHSELAQPAAGCGDLIDDNFTIVNEIRLDNGSPAAGPSGIAAAAVSHANRFTTLDPITVNYACVAVRRLGPGLTGGQLHVSVHEGDSFVGGMLRPGPRKGKRTPVTVPDVDTPAFLLVQLLDPVTVSGTVWIVVEFDDPEWAAMGVNASSEQSAHIGVRNSGLQQWFEYDKAPDPPFSQNFRGFRPIIRGLHLQPNPCPPGIRLTSALSKIKATTELGDRFTFSVRLEGPVAPTSPVLATASVSDPTEARLITPSLITFAVATWNKSQTIGVQGLDDTLPDGDVLFQVDFTLRSADPCFDHALAPSVALHNLDDETASSYTIPQVLLGGGTKSVLLISHVEGTRWDGEIRLLSGQAIPWIGLWTVNGMPVTGTHLYDVTLRRRETLRLELESSEPLQFGYLELVEKTGGRVGDPLFDNLLAPPNVSASFLYELADGLLPLSPLGDMVEVPPALRGREFRVPVEDSGLADTAIALAPYLVAGNFFLHLRLLDDNGADVGAATKTFSGQEAFFVSELFPAHGRGTLVVESQHAVYLSALRQQDTQSSSLAIVAGRLRIP